MASAAGSVAPPKPWERAGGASAGPSPFKPPSNNNSTAAVVESSSVADSGDKANGFINANSSASNGMAVSRPMPPRPWERSTPGGYSGYGTSSYGMNSYNGGNYSLYNRGGYGLASYGSGMYGGGYGSGMYGGGYGNTYGSGLYGNSYGNSMFGGGGYGMGMGMGMGVPGSFENGPGDPNNPFGAPAGPPTFWQSMLKVMHGVVVFFGRVSFLVDQNTQAFHLFITALLQLFDRSGMLYGELARFVLRMLGIRRQPKLLPNSSSISLPGSGKPALLERPKESGGAWDNVWTGDGSSMSG